MNIEFVCVCVCVYGRQRRPERSKIVFVCVSCKGVYATVSSIKGTRGQSTQRVRYGMYVLRSVLHSKAIMIRTLISITLYVDRYRAALRRNKPMVYGISIISGRQYIVIAIIGQSLVIIAPPSVCGCVFTILHPPVRCPTLLTKYYVLCISGIGQHVEYK